MLIANDWFAWRRQRACRSSGVHGWQRLQLRSLDDQTFCRHLVCRRVHARICDLAQPTRDGGICRMLVGHEPRLPHGSDERHPETALQITDEAFDFTLRLRAIRLAQTRQRASMLDEVEKARMKPVRATAIGGAAFPAWR